MTDKIEIDDRVYPKFAKMFGDLGEKLIYNMSGDIMVIDKSEVKYAFENIDFTKATSWNYISGLAYNRIKESIEFD